MLAELVHECAYRIADVDSVALYAEGVHQKAAVGDICLLTLRHEDSDDSVLAESLYAYRCGYGAVLAA